MLVAAAYVPSSDYPFVELNHVPQGHPVEPYILRRYSASGGARLPVRTADENHARTLWTVATQGNQLPEDAFDELRSC